jgi:hypothetical protein
MASKMYRSALGKPIDMGALLTKNETVRAIGNMSVNAKGDKITPVNKISETKARQVNQQYRKQIRNQIEDVPVGVTVTSNTDTVIEGFDTPLTTDKIIQEHETEKSAPQPKKGGLASAIAKAREVEQKKLATPREKARKVKGVKKI